MANVKAKKKQEPQGLRLEDEEYVRRAIAAYFRSSGPGQPMPANTSSVVEHEDKFYVELHNVNGTLAVYRIRNDGILKRLKRWPKEVEETMEAVRELAEKAKKKAGKTT